VSAKNYTSLLFLSLFFVCSCAPMTQKQSKSKGWNPLSSKQIYSLVSGNSMHLTAINFDGRIFMRKDGKLSARDLINNTDTGTWDINTENQLCLKFNTWYFGDIRCYSIYAKEGSNSYQFFTSNGARYYTGTMLSGDSAKLGKFIKEKKGSQYLRGQFAGDQPKEKKSSQTSAPVVSLKQKKYSPAKGEMEHSIKTMAQNCPGCNLEGADLRKISLINANLEGAKLKGSDLSRANLRRANLKGADLSGALLINTNLPGADLRQCDLHGANLSGANLIKADLTGADTAGAIFTGAHLEGVKGLKKQP